MCSIYCERDDRATSSRAPQSRPSHTSTRSSPRKRGSPFTGLACGVSRRAGRRPARPPGSSPTQPTEVPAFAGMTPGVGDQGADCGITISRPKPQAAPIPYRPSGQSYPHPPNPAYILPIHPARREARRTLRGNGQVGVGVSCVDQADPRGSQLSCLARSAEKPAVPGARAFLLLKNPAGRSRPGAPSTPSNRRHKADGR